LLGELTNFASRTRTIRRNSIRLTEQGQNNSRGPQKGERELAEGEVRIRNKRMRLTLVRNDKELQALTHEIESLKDTNQRLETELLTLMEGADARTAQIKELTEAVAKGRVDLTAAEKEIAAEVEGLKGNIGKTRKAREKIAENIGRRPAVALPDDFQPSRRRRGCIGEGRKPARDAGCVCRPSCTTRSRSICRSISARTASGCCITRSRRKGKSADLI